MELYKLQHSQAPEPRQWYGVVGLYIGKQKMLIMTWMMIRLKKIVVYPCSWIENETTPYSIFIQSSSFRSNYQVKPCFCM